MMTRVQSIFSIIFATSVVQAHFTFVRLSVNGEWKAPTEFIRNKTEVFTELPDPHNTDWVRRYNYPTFQTDYEASIRCGRDHMAHAAGTDTLVLQAGDTIEAAHTAYEPQQWEDNQWNDCPDGRGSCAPGWPFGVPLIIHPGPFVAHLSPVPDGTDISEYDGTGKWTKIYTLGLDVEEDGAVHWLAYNHRQLPGRPVFKIPKQTPAGDYLLRMDLIWPGLYEPPNYVAGGSQFYATCAHIRVESETEGPLPEGILIPEGVRDTEPGMRQSLAMYNEKKLDDGYTYPGGPLWTGEEMIEDKPNF
jgi:hypothetical protein